MTKNIPHCSTPTKNGVWLHTCSEDFLLSSISNELTEKERKIIISAFQNALTVFTNIKKTIHTIPKKPCFIQGLYFLNEEEMAKVLNSIKGMEQTASFNPIKAYAGAPDVMNLHFFYDILGISMNKLAYLKSYLFRYMRVIQCLSKQSERDTFGILTCIVGYDSMVEKAVTTFTYITVTGATKEKFIKINCDHDCIDESDYSFNVVKFNYSL
ncbi:hypothetical protein [uncultured Kordia sp.]|uniref:hypothetical protein n=1 Tax=uncultured Kordia sp. TaxID=507699 RepID=UPI00260D946A|nr:hypothetical protein [uncultured Kordia sp.]